MNPKLQGFLEASWQNPVFGNTFPPSSPERLQQARELLGAIAIEVVPELTGLIVAGMPEMPAEEAARIVKEEILDKTLAFVPALILHMGINDIPRLRALTMAVGLMYWGDQTMDRGDKHMPAAIRTLPQPSETDQSPAGFRARSLRVIEKKVDIFARPEDRPLVLATFYDQVLQHEVDAHELSQAYLQLQPQASEGGSAPGAPRPYNPDQTKEAAEWEQFLADHAAEFAETTTISAGLPSVACSIYAILRQHDDTLPPLAQVYADERMTDLLQVSNVVVRLWDDLGDHLMDTGTTDKGIFALNPLNQYHPDMVERFCELAHITDPATVDGLQAAFRNFHAEPEAQAAHGEYILSTLRTHIRTYVENLEQTLQTDGQHFLPFVNSVKPVIEIGEVNVQGDIAMSRPS